MPDLVSGCPLTASCSAVGPELELPDRHLVVGAKQLRGCSCRRTTGRCRPRRRRRPCRQGSPRPRGTAVRRCEWTRSALGSSTARPGGWPWCRSSRRAAHLRPRAAASGRCRRRAALGRRPGGRRRRPSRGRPGSPGARRARRRRCATTSNTATPASRARSRRFWRACWRSRCSVGRRLGASPGRRSCRGTPARPV